jgi:hypothetical protein
MSGTTNSCARCGRIITSWDIQTGEAQSYRLLVRLVASPREHTDEVCPYICKTCIHIVVAEWLAKQRRESNPPVKS